MNSLFMLELVELLFKKVPKKQAAIRESLEQIIDELRQQQQVSVSKEADQVIDDNDATQEDNESAELEVQDIEVDDVSFKPLSEELVFEIFQVFLDVNNCPLDLGLKIYELSLYMVILLIETRQLSNKANLKFFSKDSDLDLVSNLLASISQYVQKSELMYCKAILYTLGAAQAIENVDNIEFGYRAMNNLLYKLFLHLFYQGEEGLVFCSDIHVTSFFKKTFNEIYEQLVENCQYQFKSPITMAKNKLIQKLCIDEEVEYIVFIVFQTVCYYHFDFLHETGIETNIESSFVEITTYLFKSFKEKPAYGERLVKLLQKQFDSVNKVDSSNLHSVEYYTYILVIIGKIMQYAMEIDSIDMYRIGLQLIKQVHFEILEFSQLRSEFFILFDTFVLYVIQNSNKNVFKVDALMSIITLFLESSNSQVLDLYFELYDMKNLPLLTNILKILIKMVNDESIHINQEIANFKKYKVEELFDYFILNKKIIESGFTKEDLQLNNLQEMILIVFLKLFRCYHHFSTDSIELHDVERYLELSSCIDFFNAAENPNKAFNVFIKHNFCTNDRLSMVQFIIANNKVLNKAQIGQLLGGNKALNASLLQVYTAYIFDTVVQESDNHAVYYITSLRAFLNYFKTPGESQQIDRLLQAFSCEFARHSEIPQKAAYVLAYATMMLNTDIHNYSVKDKMTKSGFVSNTKRADTSFTDEFLQNLYEEITLNPLTLDEIELQRSEAIYGEIGYYCWELEKIQKILKQQLFIDEKVSILNVDELSTSYDTSTMVTTTDDEPLASKTVYFEELKPDRSENIIQKLQTNYNTQECSICLLEYYFKEIFAQFILYINATPVYLRFKFTNELVFHLYRLAEVSPDSCDLRSALITKLCASLFCYARQSYPIAEYFSQAHLLENDSYKYSTTEDRNESTTRVARCISEEITMAFLLLTIVSDEIYQSSFDFAITAFFISYQNFALVCTYLNKQNNGIALFSEPFDRPTLAALFENDEIMLKYANEFQKFYVTFPLFYQGLAVKSGKLFYLLNFDKVFAAIVLFADFSLCDFDLQQEMCKKTFKSKIEETFLYEFLTDFFVGYFIKYDEQFELSSKVAAVFLKRREKFIKQYYDTHGSARTVAEGASAAGNANGEGGSNDANDGNNSNDCNENRQMKASHSILQSQTNDLAEVQLPGFQEACEHYFFDLIYHLGNALLKIRYYSKASKLEVNIALAIEHAIMNYCTLPTPEEQIVQVMNFLSHVQRGCIVPEASLANIETIMQIVPLIIIDYQHIWCYIEFCQSSLHRIFEYNIKVEEVLNCTQCHHEKCDFVVTEALVESNRYPVLYYKNEAAWQECYQEIVIVINTLGNKIQYLKNKALHFLQKEIELLKEYYETKICQTILTSINFVFDYMYSQNELEYIDALNLLATEIVIPNLAEYHKITDNDAYNMLTQHYFKVLHTTDAFWYEKVNKTEFLNKVYDVSIKPIVLQNKQDKEYVLFQQLTNELLVVFSSKNEQNTNSAKSILHKSFKLYILLFNQKVPNKTNFEKLIEQDFYNLISCANDYESEYAEDIIDYFDELFNLFTTEKELLNDNQEELPKMFITIEQNLREDYIYQAFESICSTLNKFPLLEKGIKFKFFTIIDGVIEKLIKIAGESSLNGTNISVLVDLMNLLLSIINQHAVQLSDYNNSIGFNLLLQVVDLNELFCNIQENNQFLTMVQFTLEVIKRILDEFENDVEKCDIIHSKLIQIIKFDDIQVRMNAIDCFTEYERVVVEEREERKKLLKERMKSVAVDDE